MICHAVETKGIFSTKTVAGNVPLRHLGTALGFRKINGCFLPLVFWYLWYSDVFINHQRYNHQRFHLVATDGITTVFAEAGSVKMTWDSKKNGVFNDCFYTFLVPAEFQLICTWGTLGWISSSDSTLQKHQWRIVKKLYPVTNVATIKSCS